MNPFLALLLPNLAMGAGQALMLWAMNKVRQDEAAALPHSLPMFADPGQVVIDQTGRPVQAYGYAQLTLPADYHDPATVAWKKAQELEPHASFAERKELAEWWLAQQQ